MKMFLSGLIMPVAIPLIMIVGCFIMATISLGSRFVFCMYRD